MTTTAQIIDQHRQTSRSVGYGVTVHCACGTEHWAHVSGDQPITDENNSHRNADRQHAQHVADALRADQPRPLTAREHLDAAWEAAHVLEDGILPAGAAYIVRWRRGDTAVCHDGNDLNISATAGGHERRLLDPPAPSRPEGAEEIERLIWHAEGGGWLDDPKLLADYIASSPGVRVVTEKCTHNPPCRNAPGAPCSTGVSRGVRVTGAVTDELYTPSLKEGQA